MGPDARAVAGAAALPAAEHAHAAAEIAGRPVRLIATDGGVDVLCAAADTAAVAAALLAAGAEPMTEDAGRRRCASSAAGRATASTSTRPSSRRRPASTTAPSASPRAATSGQETVARLFYRGKPNRHLRGLRLAEPVAAGTPLTLDGREVGRVTSAVLSPRLGPIALALVRREAPPGTTLDGGAAVVELPFGE